MSENAQVIQFPRSIPAWSLGDRLRKVRREYVQTTMDGMAAALEVGPKAYAAWEADRNRPADIAGLAVKLERLTGVPRGWFLGWTDEDGPRPAGGEGQWAHRGSNPGPAD